MPKNDYITGEGIVNGKEVLAFKHGWQHQRRCAVYYGKFPINILYGDKTAKGLVWAVEIIFNKPESSA